MQVVDINMLISAAIMSIMHELATNREHKLLSATSRIYPYLIVSDDDPRWGGGVTNG